MRAEHRVRRTPPCTARAPASATRLAARPISGSSACASACRFQNATLGLARIGVAALVVAVVADVAPGRRRRGSRTARSRSSGRGSTCCRCSSRRGRSPPPATAPSARRCGAPPRRAARQRLRRVAALRGSSARSRSRPACAEPSASARGVREVLEVAEADEARRHARHHRRGLDLFAPHRQRRAGHASARVVGMPSACIASEHRNSRIDERSTARPSPMRE